MAPTQNTTDTKFSFVGLIGRPNAGKSTLLNQVVGQKVSIVTHKVQTTRRRLLGVWTQDEVQLAFVDTPGIFDSQSQTFEGQMVAAARQAVRDVDVLCVLIDCVGDWENVGGLLDEALATKKPVFLVLNKIDKIDKEKLLNITQSLTAERTLEGVFMVSALKGKGVDGLLSELGTKATVGPWYFDPDQLTDLSSKVWAAEITREVLFEEVHQELPYDLTVETEKWEEGKKDVKIHQVITVARASQKGILLGSGGQKVKRVGTASRERLGRELGKKVHLFLHVKVNAKWKEGSQALDALGLAAFPLKKK